MNARELFLLSPYQFPAATALTLSDEEMSCWMNAYSMLWHPAVLWQASGPPQVDVPYDYEQPKAHHVYAVPAEPHSTMPDDWEDAVKNAGAWFFYGKEKREETLAEGCTFLQTVTPAPLPTNAEDEQAPDNAAKPEKDPDQITTESSEQKDTDENQENAENSEVNAPTLTAEEIHAKLVTLPPEKIQPFLAIGLGYLLLASLSEAMEHDNLLDTPAFWDDIQQAIACLVGISYQPKYEAFNNSNDSDYQNSDPSTEYDRSNSDSDSYDYNGSEYDNYDYGASSSTSAPTIDPATLEPYEQYLYSAAQRIQSAREVLYPVTIYLLDLCLFNDKNPEGCWPPSFHMDLPTNCIATTAALEKLKTSNPTFFENLRTKVETEKVEICGGTYIDREDAVLPVESQLWNIAKGQSAYEELFGRPAQVFARKRFYAHPQLPLFLGSAGYSKALLMPLDDSGYPHFQSTVVSWPSPDGKQVDVFVRAPYSPDAPETLFNLANYLHTTIQQDHSATLLFSHGHKPSCPWYRDFLELARFGPIFGTWFTFSNYFNESMSGEHADARSPDEFHYDYLSERVKEAEHDSLVQTDWPVSGFAIQQRLRRQIDSCWTLAAMHRGLVGSADPLRMDDELTALEDRLETAGPRFSEPTTDLSNAIDTAEQRILSVMSERLLKSAPENNPGYLIVNPCAFKRRLALDLEAGNHPLPIDDIIRACQVEDGRMKIVAEVPALGFLWIPKSGPEGTPPQSLRMRLADDTHVRNEFFEAEIDKETGGIHGIADRRNPISRLAQRLVFNPGSKMQATSIKATSVGPALGEVVSEGVILGGQEQTLARFRQRFRAWLGRPVLEMQIEIIPEQPAAGYPWHAYFGSRFAWRDERALILRGVNGTSYVSQHVRPQTPDFLEIRSHRMNTVIFPGGMPFLHKHDGNLVDVILQPHGEKQQVFDLAIGLDREHPMQTAFGLTSPVPMITTDKGPPHVGAAGWLYHLDNPSILLLGMRAGGLEIPPTYTGEPVEQNSDRSNALRVRLLEIGAQHCQADFRTVRNPVRALLLDSKGERILDSTVNGDTVFLDMTSGDLNQLQIEF